MRLWAIVLCFAICGSLSIFLAGCIVHEGPAPEAVVQEDVVVGDPIVVEPAPIERVYIYDRGYPPGTYFYDGYYYYGGYRYERNVFVTKIVNVNIQRNRYVNVAQNRAMGRRIEQQHLMEYQRTGGRPQPAPQGHVAQRPQPAQAGRPTSNRPAQRSSRDSKELNKN